MDTTERVFFAASPNGHIHQVNLFRKRMDKFGQRIEISEAVGGGGQGSAEMIAFEDAEKKRLISVGCVRFEAFIHRLPSDNLFAKKGYNQLHGDLLDKLLPRRWYLFCAHINI